MIHNYVNLDLRRRLSLQNLIQPPLLIKLRRPPQKRLTAQPPIRNVDCLARPLQRLADCPKVVAPIDVPLHEIAFALGWKGLVSVGSGDCGSLSITSLFVVSVVSVVWIDDVCDFVDFVLQMGGFGFDVVKLGEGLQDFVVGGGENRRHRLLMSGWYQYLV